MRKFMRLLMASTALAMIAGVAGAANFIAIDAGTAGSVKTLAINQDSSTTLANTVNGALRSL
jgi:hypothetical protein